MTTSTRIDRLAASFGVRANRSFQDTVTFKRPANVASSVGGYTQTLANTAPASVPCKWEPYSGKQFQVGEKIISEQSYVIKVPATFSSSLIDVDAACQAVIAARAAGEPARTFSVDYVERVEGIEIRVFCSLEC